MMEYTPKRITLRIPAKLHKQLMELAEQSSKSMNAEIIARLQESVSNNTSNAIIKPDFTVDELRLAIREELIRNNKKLTPKP